MRITNLLLPAVLLAASLHTSAAIYKWVDDHGITHYSDNAFEAPANRQQIDHALPRVNSAETPDNSLSEILKATEKLLQPTRPKQQNFSPDRRARENSRASRCAAMQRRLDNLQSQLRRGYKEPRGNKLRERRRQLQKRLQSDCY